MKKSGVFQVKVHKYNYTLETFDIIRVSSQEKLTKMKTDFGQIAQKSAGFEWSEKLTKM